MPSLKGTQTEINLLTSFAGESQARNRYTYFASQAKKDGYIQIADIFEETAHQEKEHAKRFFKFLEGGEVEITGAFPAGVIGATVENLKAAAAGENYEHTIMYPGFAKIAAKEGFDAIAMVWESIAIAEKQHEKRYLDLAANIEASRVFKEGKKWFGAVAIAATCTKAMRRPKCVRPVPIQRPISNCWEKIGKRFPAETI
jgi:rubrerythrin